MDNKTDGRPLTSDELKLMNVPPTIFINRFLIRWTTEVKITFGELDGLGQTAPRCSVAMGIQDAVNFHGLLSQLLANWLENAKTLPKIQ